MKFLMYFFTGSVRYCIGELSILNIPWNVWKEIIATRDTTGGDDKTTLDVNTDDERKTQNQRPVRIRKECCHFQCPNEALLAENTILAR